MRELAERSGVPVATVKYYLREELLPPGVAVGATRAHYDEGHVARLRLIRALVEVAGMGLDRVRSVLAAVDSGTSVEASIGAAHYRLSPPSQAGQESTERVRRLVDERGWACDPDQTHARALAAGLDAMAAAGQPMSEQALAAYADAAALVARADLAGIGRRDADDATTFAITGTVLGEAPLLALRRMAQESIARERIRSREGAAGAVRPAGSASS